VPIRGAGAGVPMPSPEQLQGGGKKAQVNTSRIYGSGRGSDSGLVRSGLRGRFGLMSELIALVDAITGLVASGRAMLSPLLRIHVTPKNGMK